MLSFKTWALVSLTPCLIYYTFLGDLHLPAIMMPCSKASLHGLAAEGRWSVSARQQGSRAVALTLAEGPGHSAKMMESLQSQLGCVLLSRAPLTSGKEAGLQHAGKAGPTIHFAQCQVFWQLSEMMLQASPCSRPRAGLVPSSARRSAS